MARRPFLQTPARPRKAAPLPDRETIAIDGQPFVARSHYQDLKGASFALLRRYRPDKHFFLALGRDPAPIVAFLQNLGGANLATTMTASGKGWPATDAQWATYFRALIPPRALRGDRDVVLIDQTNAGSGRTIAMFEPIMQRYLDAIGSTAKIRKIGFSTGPLTAGVELLDVNPFPDVMRYLYAPYEGTVAEYDRHVPGNADVSVADVVPRPAYDRYRAAVRARMADDPALRDEIARLPGGRETYDPSGGRAFRVRPPRVTAGVGTPLGDDYDAIARLGVAALSRFSPRDHVLVGVGRSATPVHGFLQNAVGPEVARYLPEDGLGLAPSATRRAALLTYLRGVLPADALWGDRTVVLYTATESEHRLAALAEAVRGVLPHARVVVAGIASRPLPGFPTLEAPAATLERLDDRFLAAAPFGRHRIGHDAPAELRSSPAFVTLRRQLGNHMAADAELGRFLKTL